MKVYIITYLDDRYPSEPIVTAFSNEKAAREMQEHVLNTSSHVADVIFDETDVYDDYILED